MPGRRLIALVIALAMAMSACEASVSRPPEQATATPSTASIAVATPSVLPASAAPTSTSSPAFGSAPIGPTETGQVVDVVDGDTIKVSLDGLVFTVRYIGMNTPETVAPGRPIEWMGPEASAANKALVAGQTVVLEKDVSETDRYGRLLRYVWLRRPSGWLMVDRELVRTGYASVDTFPPDVRYESLFIAAERWARAAGAGLWSATPPPSASAAASGSCDPAYPTVCIPPPPPDLDCADIPYRRFTVLAPDPHHFDGDGNGIGCESG